MRSVGTVVVALVLASAARADAQGAVVELGAGAFLPPGGGTPGAAMQLDVAYQARLGWLSLAPGLRFGGYLGPEDMLAALGTVRLTAVRPLASPFVRIGVGVGGHASRPAALFMQVSAGMLMDISPRVAFGGEASYLQLRDGHFRNLYLGPLLQLAF